MPDKPAATIRALTAAPLTVVMVGAGRIGALHAANILPRDDVRLVAVVDPDDCAAERVAARHPGCLVTGSLCKAISATRPQAVMINAPTDTHVDLIETAARAGLAIFCEKPVDLSMDRVLRAAGWVRRAGVPFMIGFHRRCDPSHAEARAAILDNAVGRVLQLRVASRDPSPPPLDYLKRSGGIFRDMMIHDIDQLRFLSGREFTHVHAIGGRMIDQARFDAADDFDTATATFWTEDGVTAQVINARASPTGFEQRIEVYGADGALRIDAPSRSSLSIETKGGKKGAPFHHHFPDRYALAYRAELGNFVDAVREERPPSPGMEDAIRSLAMADAAERSARTGQIVAIDTMSAPSFREEAGKREPA